MQTRLGHAEIEAINEAIEAMPDHEYFDQLATRLYDVITLIQTHVLDADDPEAIN
jgi:hypothetical protein